jgi:hypothetical protein
MVKKLFELSEKVPLRRQTDVGLFLFELTIAQ